jgi:putative membrane protein
MADDTSTRAATAKATESVRQSAKSIERSAGAQEDSADRRTELAADRTVLAAERTYAAWVRTGLASLASGVGAKALVAKFLPGWFSGVTGSVLIAFSAFCFAAAIWRELKPGAPPPRPDTRRLPPPVLVLVNGFLILVDAFALIGIWIAPD